MTDRPDPDQPRTGAQRREPRRPRPDRGRGSQSGGHGGGQSGGPADAESGAPAVTPRALRPDGPSRKPGRALPRVGDNNPPAIDPDDAPSSAAYRFGDARLVPQRGEAPDPEQPAEPDATDPESPDPEPDTADVAIGRDDDHTGDDDTGDDHTGDDDLPDIGWGTAGARMVSSRRDPLPTEAPTVADAPPLTAAPLDTGPSAGSAGTAKALDALSALLARFDEAPNPTGEPPTGDVDDGAPAAPVEPVEPEELQLPLDAAVDAEPDVADEPETAEADIAPEPAPADTIEPDTNEPDTADEPQTDEPETAEPDTVDEHDTIEPDIAPEPAPTELHEPADTIEPATADQPETAEPDAVADDTEPTDADAVEAIEPAPLRDQTDDTEPTDDTESTGADAPSGDRAAPDRVGPDGLTPSQRVARDREVRNRLGPAADDPELAAAVVATLPPILPAAERQRSPKAPPPPRTKLTRWDRPAPPRDWRYVVGMVGRVLIVTGLLMFGFVAYQLWGTGIATARAQNDLANEFEALVLENAGEPVDTVAPDDTGETGDTGDGTTGTEPAPATTEPTTATPTPTIAPNAVVQDLPPIEPGKALARLEIPRMGKTGGDALIVVPGVDPESLQDGPGHYPDTPLPGQLGNAAIAGHRTTWGEPFADIDQLVPGDEIIVTMISGDRFVYEVASTEIVSPEDYYVVTTTDPTVAELTLTSCHPRFSARQRIAVHAFLKAEESDPVGLPTFYDIEANTTPIVGDDPTVTVPTSSPTEISGDTLEDTLGPETADGSSDTATADDDGAPVPGGPGSGPDALTAGWFHDSAAWPHIAAWGLVCAAIAVGAYLISKRFRNLAIGWSAMALPFLVCLYFLYENVNRLLPPGL